METLPYRSSGSQEQLNDSTTAGDIRHIASDVIKHFVFEDKDKAKDVGLEDENEDKDLQKQQEQ